MKTLPPLPLVDGVLMIDNSTLETYTICPRAYEYSKLHGRVSADSKPSLNFGGAIHMALEHRYREFGVGPVDPQNEGEFTELLSKWFDEKPQPVEDWRTLNWAVELLHQYLARHNFESFSLFEGDNGPLVELAFSLPLFTWCGPSGEVPVVYMGRIDLPIVDNGQLFVLDHKTTSLIGSTFFERNSMSAQQRGYCWAFEQLTGKKPRGYVINAIRTKEPPMKLTPKWWDESFQRQRYFLDQTQIDEWKASAISTISELLYLHSRDDMPMRGLFNSGCAHWGRCQFYDVCTLPPVSRGTMLASGLYTKNTWSPLTKVTSPVPNPPTPLC